MGYPAESIFTQETVVAWQGHTGYLFHPYSIGRRAMRPNRPALILAVLAVCACGDRAYPPVTELTIDTLADGSILVANPAHGLWDATPGARWRLVESLRIGTATEGGPDAFGKGIIYLTRRAASLSRSLRWCDRPPAPYPEWVANHVSAWLLYSLPPWEGLFPAPPGRP